MWKLKLILNTRGAVSQKKKKKEKGEEKKSVGFKLISTIIRKDGR